MDISELMIGDIVLFADEQVEVTSIQNCGYCESRVFIRHQDGSIWPTDPDNLKPMPLTPEILNKNGMSTIYDGDYTTVLYQTHKIKFPCDIIFIHKLQHLLGLCGINKKIEL